MGVPLIEEGGVHSHPGRSWLSLLWTILLPIAVTVSTLVTGFILTLPSPYNPHQQNSIDESSFSEDDKKNKDSGYAYYTKTRGANKSIKSDASVTVLVLGDIGRSPRMQYHVASIAASGGHVSLIGYLESELLPEIRNILADTSGTARQVSATTASSLSFPWLLHLRHFATPTRCYSLSSHLSRSSGKSEQSGMHVATAPRPQNGCWFKILLRSLLWQSHKLCVSSVIHV